ncbi:ATP phosphoribosyltransferase regulatory subunit [Phenylobacterium deserti]|uniref:ATP phosphoribosyltransferase regulatory subunit n=1 Tax=Phenylobacterium deserti TaxID=1914756 RepID=A0A328ARZ9_9CAUL|nr:ATP phosphoribosyltransferase regulatory subunit [Phenylobacterium deserti]RAK57730.1 ATP phosphoribosyltransferase regulatory subunit [Phenylobacterium deserti]
MRIEPTVPPEALGAIRAPLVVGAEPADAPILQPLGLLLDLAGEAMRARLFVVQSEGGAEACLRPDFTVAVARRHLERGAASGRYFYEGPAFRASQGAERAEEFLQLGVELFEAPGAPATSDAEIAALAWQAAAAGGRRDLSLWLGDVALFAAFIDSLSLAPGLAARLQRVAGRPRLLQAELARAGQPVQPSSGGSQLAAMLSGLSEREAAALLEEVWSLAGVEPVGGRGPAEIAARLVRRAEAQDAPALTEAQAEAIRGFMAIRTEPEAGLAQVAGLAGGRSEALEAALAAWETRLKVLNAAVPQGRLQFAPALGHAFDYYDGLTFEIRSQALGSDRPVAVGGRYDSLIARLGGPGDGRAVGCTVRPWRAFAGGEA